MARVAFISNDNLVTITGLRRADAGAYLNDATVTFTVTDTEDAAVSGVATITMSYVSGSNGNYRGTLPDEASLVEGTNYIIKITTDGGAGLKGYWEQVFTAQRRAA